jgi:Ricin-type beta-trefoil lectin domain
VVRTSGWTTLVNVNANKCLDESAPRNGAAVSIYRRTGARNQPWTYEVVNRTSSGCGTNRTQDGRCLDIKDFNQSNGAPGGLGLLERLEPGLRPELRA